MVDPDLGRPPPRWGARGLFPPPDVTQFERSGLRRRGRKWFFVPARLPAKLLDSALKLLKRPPFLVGVAKREDPLRVGVDVEFKMCIRDRG